MNTKTIKQTARLISHKVTLVLAAALMAVTMPLATAHADVFDDQISALKNEVSQYQAQIAALRAQADTLQNQINILNAEKTALQTQIDANTVRLDQLNQQIIETEQKIAEQQTVLGDNLVNIYLDSSVTPLEVLASSNSIGDYIDKQEYRDTIRQQLQESIATVKQLKIDLDAQKVALQQTLEDQSAQRDALAAKEAEQADLLAQTRGQENSYKQLSAQRNARITELRAQQVLANLKWGGNVTYEPRGGGYPSYWNDIPMDSVVDNWGMYNRECVSYTAFRVAASGRHMPYGFGNANMWPGNAKRRNIPVDSSPRAGDVAVWPVGFYGHVMYVEAVAPNGNILISEYNYDWTGRYSERTITKGTWQAQDFVFIHF